MAITSQDRTDSRSAAYRGGNFRAMKVIFLAGLLSCPTQSLPIQHPLID